MKKRRRNKIAVFTLIALLAIIPASLLAQAGSKTNTTKGTQDVTVGAFTVKVPSAWRSFSTSESEQLQRQVVAQSKEIYRQYYGVTTDPASSVNIAAFHIAGAAGSFAIVSFKIPPQSDLINVLKNQAEEKAKWGVQQGYIHKYLGLMPLDDEQFSGFYVKTIGRNGEVQVSGGLEHKKLKNTLVQLTLLCPKAWDEVKATSTLSSVLKTVMLKEKSESLPNIGGIQRPQVTMKDGEFVAYNDGTILDSRAKLIWKKDTSNKPLSWEEAITYCEELDYAGYTDWRMPTLAELQGLYNPNNNNHIETTSSIGKMQLLNRCTNLISVRPRLYRLMS